MSRPCVHRVPHSATCSLDWEECDNCGKGDRVSITDELREWAWGGTLRAGMSLRTARDQALAIADRIDAEHERVREEDFKRTRDEYYDEGWQNGYDAGIIEGSKSIDDWHPRDADNVPIEIGDMLVLQYEVWEKPYEVLSISFDGNDWFFDSNEGRFNVSGWHHCCPPTVEDVLREFAAEFVGMANHVDDHEVTDAIEMYASKLRLAGDAE